MNKKDIASVEPGSYGPLLRGILVALTALRAARDLDTRGHTFRALAELVENAAVFAERNDL